MLLKQLHQNFRVLYRCKSRAEYQCLFPHTKKFTGVQLHKTNSEEKNFVKISEQSISIDDMIDCSNNVQSSLTPNIIDNQSASPSNVSINQSKSTSREPYVILKLIAATINPSDVNTIEGTYPKKYQKTNILGNEGVFKVIARHHDSIHTLGDWVVPRITSFGTWRTYVLCADSDLNVLHRSAGAIYRTRQITQRSSVEDHEYDQKMSSATEIINKIPLEAAATLRINPGTAWRLLRDFIRLKPNDSFIQNCSTSACGQAAIQLSKIWTYQSINIIRTDRDSENLRKYLMSLGATYIFTEKELNGICKLPINKRPFPPPKLALNGVGGRVVGDMARVMDESGAIVTYGGMSKQPPIVNTSDLIFKNISLQGFWFTRWRNDTINTIESEAMFRQLITMSRRSKLKAPLTNKFSLENIHDAIQYYNSNDYYNDDIPIKKKILLIP
ncbi:hypothetical protein SNEBB_006836 [Seison nebaliae]|nr:hypothetical protein SNEBB_006836 [Seison nebaliae]